MKVLTVVGTRPEIIKLSRVIPALDASGEHVLVHTGQNYDYELNEVFFNELQIRKPDYFLEAAGETVAESIAKIISSADQVLAREKPDAVLILGDTNSGLSVIAAKRRKIPTFHMEAGNRCFDERVPEEINRRVIDHISDINLPYTEHARRYLLREGIPPDRVIKTGSPMKEVLDYYMPGIESSDVLERMELSPRRYFLVSAHREENVDEAANLSSLLESLDALHGNYGVPIVVSTHPRTRDRLANLTEDRSLEGVSFVKPLGFLDYVKLQMNALCVLSDSGTVTEESAILDVPAVTIRSAHERPEGMDEGVLIMCGLKPGGVLRAVEIVTEQHGAGELRRKLPDDYRADNVSMKVVRIIAGYTDYVDRVVWRRL